MSIFFGSDRGKYTSLIVFSLLLSMASALATLCLLYCISEIAGGSLKNGESDVLVKGISALLVLFVVSGLMQYFMARLGAGGLADLRRTLSSRAVGMSYEDFFKHRKILLSALVGDVSRIDPLFMLGPQLIYNSLLFLVCCGYLFHLSPAMFLVFSIGLVVQFFNSYLTFKKTWTYSEDMRSSEDELYHNFSVIGAGKKEMSLSLVRQKKFVGDVLLPSINKAEILTNKVYWYWGVNGTWGIVIVYSFLFLVMYCGLSFFSVGNEVIMKFVVGVFFVIGPFSFILNAGTPVVVGGGSLFRLKKIGLLSSKQDVFVECIDRPTVAKANVDLKDWRVIRFKDVTYAYNDRDGGEFELGPYNFEIYKGEITFVVGGNGSGKTTLLLLLSSLLSPTTGHIEVDGLVASENIEQYRALFSGVFNDFYLFDTVIDSKGGPVPAIAVNKMLSELDLGNKVSYRNGRLSPLDLSTGQRKRVALLQLCVDDKDIYFFDEWAADQDPEFRLHFYKTLLQELKGRGKTLVVISHDEQYFNCADRIVRLNANSTMP